MTEVYEGPADMRLGDTDLAVRVRLTGHFDPIDGRYHWRGMVFELAPDLVPRLPQPVRLSIDGHSAEGNLTEVTPWGTHTVTGIGAPPYLSCGD